MTEKKPWAHTGTTVFATEFLFPQKIANGCTLRSIFKECNTKSQFPNSRAWLLTSDRQPKCILSYRSCELPLSSFLIIPPMQPSFALPQLPDSHLAHGRFLREKHVFLLKSYTKQHCVSHPLARIRIGLLCLLGGGR